jgi:hypothetical protein
MQCLCSFGIFLLRFFIIIIFIIFHCTRKTCGSYQCKDSESSLYKIKVIICSAIRNERDQKIKSKKNVCLVKGMLIESNNGNGLAMECRILVISSFKVFKVAPSIMLSGHLKDKRGRELSGFYLL